MRRAYGVLLSMVLTLTPYASARNLVVVEQNEGMLLLEGSPELAQLRIIEPIDDAGVRRSVEAALEALRVRGYPFAAAETELSVGRDTLGISFDSGPRVVAGKDEEGGEELDAALRRLAKSAREAVDSLNEAGFPFAAAEIVPGSIRADATEITVSPKIDLQPDSYYRFGAIRFPGFPAGQWATLARQTRLSRGDPFTPKAIERGERRLLRLPAVGSTGGVRLIPAAPGVLDVEYPVSPAGSLRATGVAGVAPGNRNPVGEADIELRGFFGVGRRARFIWSGLNPVRSRTALEVSEWAPGGLPGSLEVEIESLREERIGSSTRLALRGEFEPFDDWTFGMGVASGRNAASNGSRLPSNVLWLEGSAELDRRDRPDYSADGWRIFLTAESGERRYAGGSRRAVRRDRFGGESFVWKHRDFRFYLRGEARQASGSVEAEELLRLGGIGSLRGFPEEQIAARGAAYGSLEFRRLIDDDTGHLGFFLDGALILKRDPAGSASAPFNYGSTGITASFSTGAGRMDIHVGFPFDRRFEEGRLHFRVSGEL